MIDNLIREGESLASQVQPGGMGGQMISGLEFETWAAKVIFYLEENFSDSSMTAKAIDANKRLNSNSYNNYIFLLGVIKAAKEILSQREKDVEDLVF
jgi:hypothetical protein